MRVLYLAINGTLHPSTSSYELVHGRSPWACGHREYEGVPWLSGALACWPDVKIVLTSPLPTSQGMPSVMEHLGPLAERVVGFAYVDLTTKAVRQVRTRTGSVRRLPYSSEDYWRLSKADIVTAHVEWLTPDAWVAVDDEDILWPERIADHVSIVDGLKGLKDQVEQDRLLTHLQVNFGTVVQT
jgi:hypothetical protein